VKGTIWPRPFVKDEKTGERRPLKGSTWTWQFSIVLNGKRRNISKGGYRTKRDAQHALTEALADYGKGAQVEPSKMKIADYLTREWLPVIKTSKKPSTYHTYEHFVTKRIVPALGDTRLTDLTPGDLVRFYNELRAELSERTLKQVHDIISGALRHAAEQQPPLVARNVAAIVPRDARPKPRRKADDIKCWTAPDLQTFLAGVSDDRQCALYTFASLTGMRRGELLALKWQDVNMETGQVAVRRSLVAVGAKVHEGTPKSGDARTIAIDPQTITLLKRHRAAQLEDRMRAGEMWTDTGRVFTREDGTDLRPGNVSQAFDRRAKAAPVPTLRLHDLRHTHATLALAAGVHPKVVQERLGHASIEITMDLYSHVVAGVQEEAAAKVAALVFGNALTNG
jgi:integrase